MSRTPHKNEPYVLIGIVHRSRDLRSLKQAALAQGDGPESRRPLCLAREASPGVFVPITETGEWAGNHARLQPMVEGLLQQQLKETPEYQEAEGLHRAAEAIRIDRAQVGRSLAGPGAPRRGRRVTQCDAVLAHLMRGRTLTRWQAMQFYGCANLWQRVRELKAQGHDIRCEKKQLRPNGPYVGVYSLVKATAN